ncbi:NAD+ synthase [Kiritimatiella glycovorans]|uniref:Glutamine-dependent NAD(+) synthetase n=1 Tax=Kiritimatiella glycovorans TaxID=1307763 RepID=A0A0G3ELJ0_9BACT|nr:NAD+ synthase [Kiritimatiella glycovorans]AKJ65009.1 Glutamine-dependent NAD(+) synthetase [Kiritimatiella glycovorans]
MKIGIAQINMTVGALRRNADRVLEYAGRAAEAGAEAILFPELAVCGYPPEDLILKPHFLRDCARETDRVREHLPAGITALVGAPVREGDAIYNAVSVLRDGSVLGIYRKNLLPNYAVFDEKRLFTAGEASLLFDLGPLRAAVQICEDSWFPDGAAVARLADRRPDVVLNCSASPYHRRKHREREATFRAVSQRLGAPLICCNLAGGQDELVFDGGSLALEPGGEVRCRAPLFHEDFRLVELESRGGKGLRIRGECAPELDEHEEVYGALATGLRDYVDKNGFHAVLISASGGIDSAFATVLAADALGADRVKTLTMPSAYSSEGTQSDAAALAENLGTEFFRIPIGEAFECCEKTLRGVWGEREPDIAEENMQARIRAVYAMALSNKFGWLLLSTGNKSELATGYCTLYGDMAGGFAPIKDVPKTMLYALARWRNRTHGAVLPESILTRPPSAELRPDQKDSDSLPPYDELDPILEGYVEQDLGIDALVEQGYDRALVERVVDLVDRSEFKRRQGVPGTRITPKAFGRDRRLPMVNDYRG